MNMGMKDQLHMEFSGSMTRYDPISPEQVAKLSQGGLTYAGFSEILARYGLSAEFVLHDSSRRFLHTYYADFERGVYGCLTVTREFLEGDSACLRALSSISERGNAYLRDGDWDSYYGLSDPIAAAFSDVSGQVPLPLLIYDFGKRMRMFPPEQVFGIWIAIYRRIDYANGMWAPDMLEYVFKNAPAMEKPPVGKNGLVRVFRGMGEISMPPEKAISWSTDPCNALYFANHSGRGTQFAFADVAPEDIIAFLPGYSYENEVIVRPGSVRDIRYEDMFPAKLETYLKLSLPALPEFTSFGVQAWRLGYKKEGMMEFHGLGHILRVLFLSLIYFYGSGDSLTDGDKCVLIYFSLLHDAGRTDEDEDGSHGAASLQRIKAENLRIGGLRLTKKEYQIADLVIRYHCRDDEEGISAINRQPGFSRKDKERAIKLYRICKDMDGLDRVRFNGLDYRMLRTEYAKRLPLIAGCLVKEDILAVFNESQTRDGNTENQEVAI